jgi:phenylalanyl-tRNA synthetase beta chain
MKLPISWLAEWVDIPWDAAELARRLTASGFEVEGVEPAAPPFASVCVGEILAVAPHPEADKLRVCQVIAGGAPLQIVCGAANARVGIKVPLAQVGAVLPGDVKIKAAKLRGVESAGMLCSAKELGLATSSSGLLELPDDALVGSDLRTCLALDDSVLELKVYANRGDSMSVRGVAREIAALTGGVLKTPATKAVTLQKGTNVGPAPLVQAPSAAPRLLTRRVEGLNNRGCTPLWMQERLRRAGLRSINPVVDVTNYVLVELGQPMHAYDAAKVRGPLTVRMARAGEQIQLLDERTVELAPDVLRANRHGWCHGWTGHVHYHRGERRTAGSGVLLARCDRWPRAPLRHPDRCQSALRTRCRSRRAARGHGAGDESVVVIVRWAGGGNS